MAADQVHAFLEKAKTDEGIKGKLKSLPQGQEGVAALVNIGKEAGYNFSEQDLSEALKGKESSGEISQEDLDKVSGGTIITPTIIAMTLTVCRG